MRGGLDQILNVNLVVGLQVLQRSHKLVNGILRRAVALRARGVLVEEAAAVLLL